MFNWRKRGLDRLMFTGALWQVKAGGGLAGGLCVNSGISGKNCKKCWSDLMISITMKEER